MCFRSAFSFGLAGSHKSLALALLLLMPLKPKWKLTVAISKKASPAVNADLGENNKKAFGIIQGYLNMLDVPVVLF